MVGRGVVGHIVEDDAHAQLVGAVEEPLEIGHRTELGVDGAVVADGVVGTQRPLAALFADGIDGHEPHDVDAQLAQTGQLPFGGGESALGGELAHVHFVEYGAAGPLGRSLGTGSAGSGQKQRREQQVEKSFHSLILFRSVSRIRRPGAQRKDDRRAGSRKQLQS